MIAVYSAVLYGADFIVESIRSILPFVERVYVVMMQRPWGNTEGVQYQGEWVPWPVRFDDTREKLASMAEYDRITVIETQKDTPWSRWGFAFDHVLDLSQPTEVMFIDPDCVFAEDQAKLAFTEWRDHPEYTWAAPEHVELWRTPAWCIVRPSRTMVRFIRGDLNLHRFPDPPGSRPLQRLPHEHVLSARVHNLGFCVSPSTMRWKHLTAMAFSPVVGESIPNPDWYENKWLDWRPGMRDLEISIGCESGIKEAVPYDVRCLPASIKRRYDAQEWPAW